MQIPYSLQLALAAGTLTLVLTPIVMRLAHRLGAVDQPGPRRVHMRPIPTMGGLAFAAAMLSVAWLARLLPGPASELEWGPLLGITLAALPILALGIIDDRRGVSPLAKLGVQASAAMVLHLFGLGIPLLTNPFGDPVALDGLNAVLTVAWVLIVINAVNLIDGLDGLASGVVLMASATLWWVARSHGDFYVMFFCSLMIGGAAGFLRWNFPPAKTFMGDTGSQFLGLMLAAISLLENRKGTATVTLLFPLVALALPIADSIVAFFRRAAEGRHVFGADAEHIHHRLLRVGLTHRQTVVLLWMLCGLLGLVAVRLEALPRDRAIALAAILGGLMFVAFEVITWIGRRKNGR